MKTLQYINILFVPIIILLTLYLTYLANTSNALPQKHANNNGIMDSKDYKVSSLSLSIINEDIGSSNKSVVGTVFITAMNNAKINILNNYDNITTDKDIAETKCFKDKIDYESDDSSAETIETIPVVNALIDLSLSLKAEDINNLTCDMDNFNRTVVNFMQTTIETNNTEYYKNFDFANIFRYKSLKRYGCGDWVHLQHLPTNESFYKTTVRKLAYRNIDELYNTFSLGIRERNFLCNKDFLNLNILHLFPTFFDYNNESKDVSIGRSLFYGTSNYFIIGNDSVIFYNLGPNELNKLIRKGFMNNFIAKVPFLDTIIHYYQTIFSCSEYFEKSDLCKDPKKYLLNLIESTDIEKLFSFEPHFLENIKKIKKAHKTNFLLNTPIDLAVSDCFDFVMKAISLVLYDIWKTYDYNFEDATRKTIKGVFKLFHFYQQNLINEETSLKSVLPYNFTTEYYAKKIYLEALVEKQNEGNRTDNYNNNTSSIKICDEIGKVECLNNEILNAHFNSELGNETKFKVDTYLKEIIKNLILKSKSDVFPYINTKQILVIIDDVNNVPSEFVYNLKDKLLNNCELNDYYSSWIKYSGDVVFYFLIRKQN